MTPDPNSPLNTSDSATTSSSSNSNSSEGNGFYPNSELAAATPSRISLRAKSQPPQGLIILLALVLMGVGFAIDNLWLGLSGGAVALVVSLRVIWVSIRPIVSDLISPQQVTLSIAIFGGLVALVGLLSLTRARRWVQAFYGSLNWDEVGALGEVFGALGQILIAVLAVYVAWRQYIIERELTLQQNRITQQQTIDSYFQGISELVLDEEGLLEDWPQERAIAEGRTAAILGSVDAAGKAKIVRFLSKSRLLTPLKRDRRLGRAILDGSGGYQEDREYGIRVIDLGVMLAASDLAGTDLRWTDLSDANLIRADLQRCDLVRTNFSRTVLCEADLSGSDLMGTRFFYGAATTASPRTRHNLPDYKTGAFTGAVVEGADFTGVQRLSEEQRYYCCAWGGAETRSTIPGGCDGIPNRLEQ